MTRIALDATPLLGLQTGVGRYVTGLVTALARSPQAPDLTLAAFTARGARAVPAPPGARVAGRPFPARLLHVLWRHVEIPPVEWLTGSCDVFHATNFVLPPLRRAKGVVTIHDTAFVTHPETVAPAVQHYRQLVPLSIRRAEAVVTLASTTADEIAERFGIDRDRVHVTPPGVDPAWSAAHPPTPDRRRELGLPDQYLLFVGTTEPRKNLSDLIAALRIGHARTPGELPPLVIAGTAGWGAPLDTAGLPAGAVIRAGFVPDDVLPSIVAGAAALIYPSRYEGFGLPPLEALACGTPVIASDLPVLREVNGSHATYVPVGDPEALLAALLSGLADDGGSAAREARRTHARQFTWDRCAAATLDVYASVLD